MRKTIVAVVVFLGLAAAGWTALWTYGAREAGRSLDAWMAREAAESRRWTCPGRAVSGFPFAIAVACEHPSFSGLVLGDTAGGSLGALRLRASLGDPRHAVVSLAGPFAYRAADGLTDFSIAWSTMTIDLAGFPAGIGTVGIAGTDIAVNGRFGTPDVQTGGAAKGEVTITPVADAANPTVDFTLTFNGAAIPALDDLIGGTDPNTIDIAGRLTQAVFADASSTPALIERWRQAGGQLALASARITRGTSELQVSGPLHLDDAHRIAGRLDATFVGLAPILRRYGIDPNIATAGAILNSLFGGDRGARKPAGDPNAIRLPIRFEDGRLGVGPVQTPIALTPLY